MHRNNTAPVQSEEDIKTQDLLKQVRNVTLLFGLLFIALGTLLIFFPNEMTNLLWIIFGIASLVFGIYRLIRYFTVQRYETVIASELFFGILFVVFGVLALVKRGVIVDNMFFIFGIMILGGSVLKIQTAINLAQVGYFKWWIVLVFGLIAAGVGTFLLLEPDIIEANILIVSSAFLIYDGVSAVISAIILSIVRRRLRKGIAVSPVREPKEPAAMEAETNPAAGQAEPASYASSYTGNYASSNPDPAPEPAPFEDVTSDYTGASNESSAAVFDAEFTPVSETPAEGDPFAAVQETRQPKFDPDTGEPLVRKPRFDPDTGKPLFSEDEN